MSNDDRRPLRCRTKIRYRDEIAAKTQAAWFRGDNECGSSLTGTQVYRCPFCRGWHLTSLTPEGYKARRREFRRRN